MESSGLVISTLRLITSRTFILTSSAHWRSLGPRGGEQDSWLPQVPLQSLPIREATPAAGWSEEAMCSQEAANSERGQRPARPDGAIESQPDQTGEQHDRAYGEGVAPAVGAADLGAQRFDLRSLYQHAHDAALRTVQRAFDHGWQHAGGFEQLRHLHAQAPENLAHSHALAHPLPQD